MAELLTRAEIAVILGISDETDIPQEVVDWAEIQVQKVVGKNYTLVTDATEEFFFTRSQDEQTAIYLSRLNVTITKVEYRGLDDDDWSEKEDTDYYTDAEIGVVIFTASLSLNTRYRVTFSYGGDDATDLEKKLQFLFVLDYLQKYKSDVLGSAAAASGDVKKEKIGDYSVEYDIGSTSSTAQTKAEKDIQALIALLGGNYGDYENTEIL